MKRKPFLLLFLLTLLFGVDLPAQGSWTPAGADLSRPRVLLKSSEVPALQAALSSMPELLPVLEKATQLTNLNMPAGSTTVKDRMDRSYIAKECAFLAYIDRKWDAGTAISLSQVEKDSLIAKSLAAMNGANYAVDDLANYENWIWRSRELINYLTAYDLQKAYGTPDSLLASAKHKIHVMAGDLHFEATRNIVGYTFYNFAANNHGLCTSAALGMAAIVLNDADSSDVNYQASSWIHTGMFQVDHILWRTGDRQSEPGVMSGYAEGPHYFKVAFQNCLPFFKAYGYFLPDGTENYTFGTTTRAVRNPWFDPNYDLLYDWIARIRMPDGRLPALDDTYNNDFILELAIPGRAEYHAPYAFTRMEPAQGWSVRDHISLINDMAPDFLSAHTATGYPAAKPFQVLPEAGSLVFRSGWDTAATYMHLIGEHGRARTEGGGHNQADVSSFILMANGRMLAMDPGYMSYALRDSVSGADSHSMILVDGKGPAPGSVGVSGGADGYIEGAFDMNFLDYGEIRTNYEQTDIVRKVMFVRDRYFWVSDEVRAATTHNYTWQLHGYGRANGAADEGDFYLNGTSQEAIWTNTDMHLYTRVTARNGITGIDTTLDDHDLNSAQYRWHNTLHVERAGSDADFLAALVPFATDTPDVELYSAGNSAVMRYLDSGHKDVVVVQEDTVFHTTPAAMIGTAGDLSCDGQVALWSEDSTGAFALCFMDEGQSLILNGLEYVHAEPRMDAAFEIIDDTSALAWAGAAGTLWLTYNDVPLSVWGPEVDSWTYLFGSGRIMVTTSGPGLIHIYTTEVTSRAEPEVPAFQLYPNPAEGTLYLRIAGAEKSNGTLQIFNAFGQEVSEAQHFSLAAGNGPLELHIHDLPAGMYFLRIREREGTDTVLRFVKR